MPFCPYCGVSVKEKHKFCPNCSKELEFVEVKKPVEESPSTPPSIQHVEPVSQETIKVIIPNLSKPKSFGRVDVFNLIVTEHRSIFAKLTNNIMTETIKKHRAKAEAEGKGFFGKWKAQMQGFNTYTDWYADKTPEQSLNETPGNYVVENSIIKNLKISEDNDDEGGMTMYDVELTTVTGKLQFKTQYDPTKLFVEAYPLTKT
jgi:hypothetical protein